MPSLVFSNMVANPNATNPVSLNLTLINNGVSANSLGAGVKAVLFNAVTTPGNDVNITLTQGSYTANLNVNENYDGKTMALLLTNGLSYSFVVDTGTTAQTLTFNGYDSVSPEKIRKWGQENGGN